MSSNAVNLPLAPRFSATAVDSLMPTTDGATTPLSMKLDWVIRQKMDIECFGFDNNRQLYSGAMSTSVCLFAFCGGVIDTDLVWEGGGGRGLLRITPSIGFRTRAKFWLPLLFSRQKQRRDSLPAASLAKMGLPFAGNGQGLWWCRVKRDGNTQWF